MLFFAFPIKLISIGSWRLILRFDSGGLDGTRSTAAKTIIDFLADEGWTYKGSGRAF